MSSKKRVAMIDPSLLGSIKKGKVESGFIVKSEDYNSPPVRRKSLPSTDPPKKASKKKPIFIANELLMGVVSADASAKQSSPRVFQQSVSSSAASAHSKSTPVPNQISERHPKTSPKTPTVSKLKTPPKANPFQRSASPKANPFQRSASPKVNSFQRPSPKVKRTKSPHTDEFSKKTESAQPRNSFQGSYAGDQGENSKYSWSSSDTPHANDHSYLTTYSSSPSSSPVSAFTFPSSAPISSPHSSINETVTNVHPTPRNYDDENDEAWPTDQSQHLQYGQYQPENETIVSVRKVHPISTELAFDAPVRTSQKGRALPPIRPFLLSPHQQDSPVPYQHDVSSYRDTDQAVRVPFRQVALPSNILDRVPSSPAVSNQVMFSPPDSPASPELPRRNLSASFLSPERPRVSVVPNDQRISGWYPPLWVVFGVALPLVVFLAMFVLPFLQPRTNDQQNQFLLLPPDTHLQPDAVPIFERITSFISTSFVSFCDLLSQTIHDIFVKPVSTFLFDQIHNFLLVGCFFLFLWLCRWRWKCWRQEKHEAQVVADQIFSVLSRTRNHIAIQHLQTKYEKEGVSKGVWTRVVQLVEADSRVKRMQKRKGDMPIVRACWIWESDLDYISKFAHP